MPTKILVLETPTFQLGVNAGEHAERLSPMAFSERLQKHRESGSKENLFVLGPEEVLFHTLFLEAMQGPGSVTMALFSKPEDCVRFLPSLSIFTSETRSLGVKDCLAKGSVIFQESFFNGNNVGSKLDPCFAFARRNLPSLAAINAWGALQALVFHGLQSLPDCGEKGSGEKLDVQVGADERNLAITVRFDLPPEQAGLARSSPLLTLPRLSSGVFECRYLANGRKIEFNCLFPRTNAPAKTVEISGFYASTELEDAEKVASYQFKGFGAIDGSVPEETRVFKNDGGGKSSFKKKFSTQIEPEAAPVVVSGGSMGASTIAELEGRIKALEANLKLKNEALAKANESLSAQNDPLNKRDVITNIKDTQSEGLKQNIKVLETELEEAKSREKELMKMVDKAVQMKDEAAKKIKELDLKLKQAGGAKGSKEQQLEKVIEEQKRQNKELSAKVSELTSKLTQKKTAA